MRAPDTWLKSQDALKSKLPVCLDPPDAYMQAKGRRIQELAELGQIFDCLKDLPFLNGVFALLMRTVLYVIFVAIMALFVTLLVHVFVSDKVPEAGSGGADGVLSDREQTIYDLMNNVYSPHALTAVSTAVAFLVVTRLQTNVAQNRQIYELFFAICGTTCAIAIECRSFAPHLNAQDIKMCSKISRVLASIPYALIEKFRYGDEYETTRKLWVDVYNTKKLPLFDIPHHPDQSDTATRGVAYDLLRDCKRVQNLNLPMYESLLLLLTMYVNSMEKEGVAPPKVGFLAGNIRALASDEGKITGMTSFQRPTAVTTLMYFVLFMWYVLLLLTDLVPNNKWHSVYLMSVIGLSTIGFYGLAEEIKNPFAITTLGIPGTWLSKKVAGPSSINQQRTIAIECSKTEGVVMTILGEEIFYMNKPTLYGKRARLGLMKPESNDSFSSLDSSEPSEESSDRASPVPPPLKNSFRLIMPSPQRPAPPPAPMRPTRGPSSPKPAPEPEPDESGSDFELTTSGGLLLTSRWCTGGASAGRRRLAAVRE